MSTLRSRLLAGPSGRCMRAAAYAASPAAFRAIAEKQAAKQFAALTGEVAGAPITPTAPAYLPPAVYADAKAAGYDMRHYARTTPIPTR